MGGNAVIRRSVLTRVGPYRTDIGRSGTRLMSCEDEDMFKRLLASGARGFYRPDLIIHHYVSPERVTRSYFRKWCFWHGVSLGILDRQHAQNVPYMLGTPRYLDRESGSSGCRAQLKGVFTRPLTRPSTSLASSSGGTCSASYTAAIGCVPASNSRVDTSATVRDTPA